MLKNRVKETRLLSPTCFEGRRTRIGVASLAASNGGADVPARPAGSSRRLGQITDADQVVDRQAEDEHPAHPAPAAVARLAQQADGLEPPEDLFHALAFPLAHPVAGVACGALIDRTRTIRRVLGHVRRDLEQPERSEEHTSELQSLAYLVCRLLLEKKKT